MAIPSAAGAAAIAAFSAEYAPDQTHAPAAATAATLERSLGTVHMLLLAGLQRAQQAFRFWPSLPRNYITVATVSMMGTETHQEAIQSCSLVLKTAGCHPAHSHATTMVSGRNKMPPDQEAQHVVHSIPQNRRTAPAPAPLMGANTKVLQSLLAGPLCRPAKPRQKPCCARTASVGVHGWVSESEEASASSVRDTRKQPLLLAAISAVHAGSAQILKLGSASMPPGSRLYTPAVYL